ncbi:MAG: GTPase ObgE [Candidatus Bipolaricaulota bacterium]
MDEARIHVSAGKGGDGLISFHRTRRTPRGTPDGGDGGDGGSVILRPTRSMNTLLHFQNQIHHKAQKGTPGGPNNRRGARGANLEVGVPVGTLVRDLHTQELLADLAREDDEFVAARGGRGGRGNRSFTTSTRQAPKVRELGEPGEERWLSLELRMLADVGVVGFPNAGKSSLVSRISRVRPKVAAYPFTTVQPSLGTVATGEVSFVVADLPGLIEGAHRGRGLGDRFLRHATRAKVLLHLVDLAGVEDRDPLADYRTIRQELDAWEGLKGRPEVVAGNKMDLLGEDEVRKLVERFGGEGVEVHPISALTGQGVQTVLGLLAECLEGQQGEKAEPAAERSKTWKLTPEGPAFWVEERDEVLEVWGESVERLVRRLDLSAPDGLSYLQERLARMGVMAALRRSGMKDGDIVRIGGVELEFER